MHVNTSGLLPKNRVRAPVMQQRAPSRAVMIALVARGNSVHAVGWTGGNESYQQ